MRLTVVGCSGSFPGPDSPASCYLVEAEGFRLVVDLGSGALGPLQRSCPVADIDTVLISHLHADHVMDLLSLYVARRYDPVRRHAALPVRGPSGIARQLAAAYGRGEEGAMSAVFDFGAWSAGTHAIGPFEVSVRRMAHPVQTWGMRIEHDGRVLAYSADTGPCEALVSLAEDADLLLCEASFQDGCDDNTPDLHLTGVQAGEAAMRSGARRLLVTHVPPWFDPTSALAEARTAFRGPAELARAGATYEI